MDRDKMEAVWKAHTDAEFGPISLFCCGRIVSDLLAIRGDDTYRCGAMSRILECQ